MSSLPQHTGHYYYVSHPGANHKTHYTANAKCAQFGGYLVEINNKGEYDFAVSILKSMHTYEVISILICGSTRLINRLQTAARTSACTWASPTCSTGAHRLPCSGV